MRLSFTFIIKKIKYFFIKRGFDIRIVHQTHNITILFDKHDNFEGKKKLHR